MFDEFMNLRLYIFSIGFGKRCWAFGWVGKDIHCYNSFFGSELGWTTIKLSRHELEVTKDEHDSIRRPLEVMRGRL